MKQYLNRRIARFLVVLLVGYGVWFVAYELIIKPDGRLDEMAALSVAATAGAALQGFGLNAVTNDRNVRMVDYLGVTVVDGCNGLAALGLFAGFVLAYPGTWRRRLWFIPFGLLVVFLANVIRVGSLAYFQQAWPAAFDLIHNVGVSTFFYLVVFGLWIVWANFGGSDEGLVLPTEVLPTEKVPAS